MATKKKCKNLGSYLVMALVVLLIAFPFYILIITSLMTEQEGNSANFRWWPQMGFTLQGYKDVLFKEMAGINILKGFFNTLWIYIPGILVGLYVSVWRRLRLQRCVLNSRARCLQFCFRR